MQAAYPARVARSHSISVTMRLCRRWAAACHSDSSRDSIIGAASVITEPGPESLIRDVRNCQCTHG